MKKIKLTCKEATFLSLQQEEGKLPLADRIKIFLHLLSCPPCRRFIEQSKLINQKLKAYNRSLHTRVKEALSPDSKKAMQNKINDALK